MKECFRVVGQPITGPAERALAVWVGKPLPTAYVALLRESNGAEWALHDAGGDCLRIWEAEIVAEYNGGYGIQRWLPGTFAFGSDGGDDALLLDCLASPDPEQWPVVRVGFGALDREEFCLQASTFADWAEAGFRLSRGPAPRFDLPTKSEVTEDVAKILKEFPEGDKPF